MVIMSQKKRKIFNHQSTQSYELSRSRIEMFYECPRCFYLYAKFGIDRPSWPAFTLHSAVDTLLKKEFDIHRTFKRAHPLMKTYGIDAVPFDYSKINEWRNNFVGLRTHHLSTNLIIFGAVDDIWLGPDKTLMVVDYKATSTNQKIDLDGQYKQSFKRQMEIYQWLLKRQKELTEKGYKVSNKGFFVYANARKDERAFDKKLEFDVEIITYTGDDSWVEPKIIEAHKCLMNDKIPLPNLDCEYCQYRQAAKNYEK